MNTYNVASYIYTLPKCTWKKKTERKMHSKLNYVILFLCLIAIGIALKYMVSKGYPIVRIKRIGLLYQKLKLILLKSSKRHVYIIAKSLPFIAFSVAIKLTSFSESLNPVWPSLKIKSLLSKQFKHFTDSFKIMLKTKSQLVKIKSQMSNQINLKL